MPGGVDIELQPVGHIELLVDRTQVVAQCVLGDEQALRQRLVGSALALHHQRDDAAFARCQAGLPQGFRVRLAGTDRVSELCEDAPQRAAVQPQLTLMGFDDGLEHMLGRGVLAQDAACAFLHRLVEYVLLAFAGENQDPRTALVQQRG